MTKSATYAVCFALALSLGGCSQKVEIEELTFACSEDDQCGAGKLCSDGVCVPEAVALADVTPSDDADGGGAHRV